MHREFSSIMDRSIFWTPPLCIHTQTVPETFGQLNHGQKYFLNAAIMYTQTVPETLGAHGGHAGGPPAFVSTRHCLLGITNTSNSKTSARVQCVTECGHCLVHHSKTSALVQCVTECGRLSLSGSSQQNLSTCAVCNGVWPTVTVWFITAKPQHLCSV